MVSRGPIELKYAAQLLQASGQIEEFRWEKAEKICRASTWGLKTLGLCMCKDVGNLDEIYGWATLRRIQSAKMIKVIGGPDMSIIHVCMVLMNLQ